ncbi:MAG: hypothetical protein OEZ36_06030, partial [Spirochaetota bacterium]|nr:hypothetical protein [Spirochaetota bacterium]
TKAKKIDNVIFIAKVNTDSNDFIININENDVSLKKNEWNLFWAENKSIELDKTFILSVDQTKLSDIENLFILIKYSF